MQMDGGRGSSDLPAVFAEIHTDPKEASLQTMWTCPVQ